jgi:hypothetical protein
VINPNAFQIGIVWYLSQKMKEYGGEHLFLYLKNYDLFVYHATTSLPVSFQFFRKRPLACLTGLALVVFSHTVEKQKQEY